MDPFARSGRVLIGLGALASLAGHPTVTPYPLDPTGGQVLAQTITFSNLVPVGLAAIAVGSGLVSARSDGGRRLRVGVASGLLAVAAGLYAALAAGVSFLPSGGAPPTEVVVGQVAVAAAMLALAAAARGAVTRTLLVGAAVGAVALLPLLDAAMPQPIAIELTAMLAALGPLAFADAADIAPERTGGSQPEIIPAIAS